MSHKSRIEKTNNSIGCWCEVIDGVIKFKSQLEKYFFATVNIKCSNCTDDCSTLTDLVINIDCNFGIIEGLHHFENGNWGSAFENELAEASIFQKGLHQLSIQNKVDVDIKEISINFSDTSIIITKIHQRSIPEQFNAIFEAIAANIYYFSKGHTNIPYEIFIPAFEEDQVDLIPVNYFEYWVLYFDEAAFGGSDEAMIYDLKYKLLVEEDFYLEYS